MTVWLWDQRPGATWRCPARVRSTGHLLGFLIARCWRRPVRGGRRRLRASCRAWLRAWVSLVPLAAAWVKMLLRMMRTQVR